MELPQVEQQREDYLSDDLQDETMSFLEDTRNEIIYRSSIQQTRKRRIYSNVHLDPKKSGRRFRANDRERRRMESLNGALDALKGCIPMPKTKKRMTKLHILRLACNYIKALTEILQAAAVQLGESNCGGGINDEKSRALINGLSIAQRLDFLSRIGRFHN